MKCLNSHCYIFVTGWTDMLINYADRAKQVQAYKCTKINFMEGIMDKILEILNNAKNRKVPEAGTEIPHGDMPGDQVCIGPGHISKSKVIFTELLKILPDIIKAAKTAGQLSRSAVVLA